MNFDNTSIAQLKKWLSVLDLPTTGSKRELILRLNNSQKEMQKKFESLKNGEDGNEDNEDDGEIENTEDSYEEADEDGDGANFKEKDGEEDEDGDNNGRKGGEEDEDGDNNGRKGGEEDEDGDNNGRKGGEEDEDGDNNDGKGGKIYEDGDNGELGEEKEIKNSSQILDISLRMATEVLNEFSGETCARKWITQMFNIGSIYGVSGQYIKMLMISKIKGKAKLWLHANPGRILLPMEDLIDDLIGMFGEKASKLETRRKFEERKWSAGESFGSYVDDKVMLAQGINVDAEELLSVVIEGIPNIGLRIQAQIQCFDDVKQLKRAFADVGLPKPYGAKKEATSLQSKDDNIMRCFNCNARGHWAKDCRKPKREKGSCYACGEMGHFVAQCLKNKTKGVGDNNYNAS
ncbi:uncharacterized protein LOC122319990 [Drosophila ficusphila]|uniref:uncharacterized protein LOC122319990 n=1 Tax=Drosophila ficusphila TaxID=30025 RepID=UPI001C8AA88D|nr:uncharacterized protein LOC122319990 [Drosophila ficusphila]